MLSKEIEDESKMKCLLQVKQKIWAMKYKSRTDFETDIKQAVRFIVDCLGTFDPKIKDAAKTAKIFFSTKLQQQKRKYPVRRWEIEMNQTSRLPTSAAFNLFPTISNIANNKAQMKSSDTNGEVWGLDLARKILKSNSGVKRVSKKIDKIEDLIKTVKKVSRLPKEVSLIPIENAKPVSSILDRLIDQENATIALLEQFKSIRRDIEINEHAKEALKHNEKAVSLGDLTLVAEFRLSNRNLKAQIKSLQTQLNIEKRKREESEEKLKKVINALHA